MNNIFICAMGGRMQSYGSWIYNYLCYQCLPPLKLWIRTLFMARCTRYKICDNVCQWLAAGQWTSLGTPVSSTIKTDCHDITEILMKVAFNTINKPYVPWVISLDFKSSLGFVLYAAASDYPCDKIHNNRWQLFKRQTKNAQLPFPCKRTN